YHYGQEDRAELPAQTNYSRPRRSAARAVILFLGLMASSRASPKGNTPQKPYRYSLTVFKF
ncbi:hypothetical protein, partial [Pseudomonas sp. Irchel s3h14]|uniref:hypothetical protein n=1 Tax=Pseudomonas sp. Irchel s3h14 TaxID=2009179 RepID=UPI001C45D834